MFLKIDVYSKTRLKGEKNLPQLVSLTFAETTSFCEIT